jgi:hypothetical protein
MALLQVGVCHEYGAGGRPRLLDVVDGKLGVSIDIEGLACKGGMGHFGKVQGEILVYKGVVVKFQAGPPKT